MRSIGRAGTRHGAALLAAVACVLALLVAGPASAAKRVALVIGNARAVRLEHGGSVVDLAPHIRGTVARLTVN